MTKSDMRQTIATMVAPGRGVLAADESTGTIKKRFDGIGVQSTDETRRAYRDLLFSAEGVEEFIGGVILFDETMRQVDSDRKPFPQLLAEKGIAPGIKVDSGARHLPGFEGETITEGLDGLRERLAEYRAMGARFAKWRGVIHIDDRHPSWTCVKSNAHALARYAALCQEASVVPIVEPEVLMEGDHNIERCYEVTHWVLRTTFSELADAGVAFEEMLLKPNMVIGGKGCAEQTGSEEIAEMTLACFNEVVPTAVPGIVFLSGGQSEVEATANLNAMNAAGSWPWELSFSYGRALQQSALQAWVGEPEKVEKAQSAFMHRARMNSLARDGEWAAGMEG